MSDHYYSNNPQSKMVTETNDYTIRDHVLTLTTSTGVFSKKGIDFGSRLLIETFEAPSVQGDFLDLGCGYGPIGLTLAKEFSDRHVKMVDVNERAVMLTEKNARQNDMKNVTVQQSDGFSTISSETFAAIITNPPIRTGKKVIYPFFEKSAMQLVSGGSLWVVVQKKQGAPSLMKFLETLFPLVEVRARKKGYYIIQATKE